MDEMIARAELDVLPSRLFMRANLVWYETATGLVCVVEGSSLAACQHDDPRLAMQLGDFGIDLEGGEEVLQIPIWEQGDDRDDVNRRIRLLLRLTGDVLPRVNPMAR